MKHLLALLFFCPALAMAADHTVAQKGKAFSVASLAIKVGDKVAFRNDDPFAHNIFTLSDPMQFDLGTYPQGQAKSVTFTKAGQYEIECAIHPEMKMLINVKP
ncbi:plastocyanin/azurin family copper-binding protein [Aquabacterium sp.]|uniref:cupredoxin domain-containing protein n=1 Tax=Aquabacterium sp. TaxID=1872578 RepID=UPI0025C1DB81|nr:plastocyanin/azurin family copper-binding protein [Aquabacterium sp.]